MAAGKEHGGVRIATRQGGLDCLIDPAVPFATLVANAIAKAIGELTIPIASIDDLIALKRAAGRAIDLADIEALRRLKQLGLDH